MSTHRTVLVVADSDERNHDYKHQLQQEDSFAYKILTVRHQPKILATASSQQIDGILLALSPCPGNFEVLRQLKAHMGDRCPPIVVIAENDAEMAVQAFKQGAADYLVKDRMTPEGLRFTMRSAIENAELPREPHRTQEQFHTSVENMAAVDLTQQKQAEAAIQQLNQDLANRVAELQTLLDVIPVGIAIATDPSCIQMQSNAYIRQLLGVSPGAKISKSAPAHEHPPYRVFQNGQEIPTEDLPMQVAVRLGIDVRDVEFDIVLPDGTVRQILSYATPLWDDQKQIRGTIGAFLDITERNQDAAALKASQQRYQELAEAMPQIVWTADATGTVNYWNQRWYEYTGFSEAESMGVIGMNAVHPDDRDRTLEQWSQALANGELFENEYQIRRWDGVYHWFISRAVPTRDSQNHITGWIGTITNIDDLKHSQALLRQREQQLQRQLAEIEVIYQSAPIGLNVLDTDLRFVRINQRLAEINGFPVEAHIGRTIREVLPDLAGAAEQLLRPVLETGEPLLNVEIHGETPAQPGRQRTWLEHFIPLKHGDRVIGISTVCEEITERVQVEAALRQSEERFRNLADNAPMMVWVTDTSGYCTYLSKSWCEFTGQTEATGLGFGWLTAVHPDDREFSKGIFIKAIEQHEAFRLEYRLRRQDGEYRWVIDAASPWFSEEDEFKGYIGSVVEIHDRKQAEEALRRSEERHRTLFETMNEGFCVVEVLFDKHNTPIDYRFLEMNPAFEQQTGLQQAEGKTARQLLPDLEQHWFELYGNVALTGEPVRFEHGSEAMNRWFDVSAFPIGQPESRKVAILFRDISQRKQTERELQESEARFRTLADNMSQLAWMTNEEGSIFWYNQRWFDYTGTTPEQVQGWGWQVVHHPEHLERVLNKFRHCIATGETWEDTFPLRGKDGQYRWFLSRAIPIRDEQGNVLRWFGTNTDITELRQTEIALQQTTERLNVALKSAPLTLFNQDLDLRYIWIYNPTHDYAISEVIGQRDADLTSPETAARLTQLKQQVLDTGVGLREEVQVTDKKGQSLYYDLTIDPILDEQNAIVGVTCAAVDISERARLEADRKRAEEALRQSEDRLRMAIESAELGTWDWNLTTNELAWDDGCKAMFGLPPEAESSIEEFYRRLHPDDHDRLEQAVNWSCNPASGGNYEVEYRIIGRQDGIERWIAAKGQAYFDASGNPRRFIGTVLDITEQKQTEAQREQLFQREQAAREAAERANRIKDEFLAVLSHELRSPLNPILGWSRLLQTRKFDEKRMVEALATIERNAKLQAQLIDDLLDVAKILRGKLSLNITAVNLAFVIEAAIETVRSAAEAKGILLRSALPNIGQVSGDAARLQQVVWNLLSNAIKFTPENGQVTIQLEQVGNQAEITVKDTGKGINPAFLPHIFESFRQEDASTTRQYGGLGLGLAIVRQLVEAQGGTVRAESRGEGLGATFTIRLPLLHAVPGLKPADKQPQAELSLSGVRILAVDDEPDARELLTVLLTQYGAAVLTVTSAAEVLAALESFQPDVLVSDIGMPNVDGYSLIRQVRALPAHKGGRIPAIALTAYARETDHQQALKSGYQKHVTKPLEPEQLIQAVSTLASCRNTP
jgi:PAS domain S-box-containing protein